MEHLNHSTTLENLYSILSSGRLISRSQGNFKRNLSSENKGDPNFIYLTVETEDVKPKLGSVNIQLKMQLLYDRKDYFLNTGWHYGITEATMTSDKVAEWLGMVGIYGEVLFQDAISIEPYLEKIIVRQLPGDILEKIGEHDKTVYQTLINYDRIPQKFKKYIILTY